MPGSGSCKAANTDQGGRCPRATEYSADLDYDLQGLFEISEQQQQPGALAEFMLL